MLNHNSLADCRSGATGAPLGGTAVAAAAIRPKPREDRHKVCYGPVNGISEGTGRMCWLIDWLMLLMLVDVGWLSIWQSTSNLLRTYVFSFPEVDRFAASPTGMSVSRGRLSFGAPVSALWSLWCGSASPWSLGAQLPRSKGLSSCRQDRRMLRCMWILRYEIQIGIFVETVRFSSRELLDSCSFLDLKVQRLGNTDRLPAFVAQVEGDQINVSWNYRALLPMPRPESYGRNCSL